MYAELYMLDIVQFFIKINKYALYSFQVGADKLPKMVPIK